MPTIYINIASNLKSASETMGGPGSKNIYVYVYVTGHARKSML